MKKVFGLTLVFSLALVLFSGCDYHPTAEDKQTAQTMQTLDEINRQVGMPEIKEFYEKKLMKEIYELRDNSKLITYAYTQGMDGRMVYIGQCMGFGLPYATQYTNPQQYTRVHAAYSDGTSNASSYNFEVMPQADPNGLYMPESAQATWLMMINSQGKPEIMYCEPNTVVTQSKLPKRLCAEWSLPSDY